jgi:hypothetical protein
MNTDVPQKSIRIPAGFEPQTLKIVCEIYNIYHTQILNNTIIQKSTISIIWYNYSVKVV